jgi:hypothetical protein
VTNEKAIFIDLANGLESLALAVDAIEAILIRSKLSSSDQFEQEKSLHLVDVRKRLESMRLAIGGLA